MRAVRLQSWDGTAELVETPRPVPGPGQALVKVLAAGLCHSDLHVIDAAAGQLPFELPFTLGHEIVGEVVQSADAAEREGHRFAVYAPWGCGTCMRCLEGEMNYCDAAATESISGLGLGTDGGLAEYVAVDLHRLVDLGRLDPAQAVPLTDAGLTSWHAISRTAGQLPAESNVLVIGIGGLGHLAVQLLRATTSAIVIGGDARDAARILALDSGAHHAVDTTRPDALAALRRLSPPGYDLVLDFVGTLATIDLAVAVVRSNGHLSIVGSGGGRLDVAKPGVLVPGLTVSLPFWGSRTELEEVLRMAAQGGITPEVTTYALSDFDVAIDHLRNGKVLGRAVLLPNPDG